MARRKIKREIKLGSMWHICKEITLSTVLRTECRDRREGGSVHSEPSVLIQAGQQWYQVADEMGISLVLITGRVPQNLDMTYKTATECHRTRNLKAGPKRYGTVQ